ncbi:hypothetical protein [Sphingomonas mali]|uniref:hypothetical protein n=1 Tax=Sphingomonas mali TaxID=40682 RepID=UPI00082B1952|nr:hypothetical protein [Sphingomonas mali]
MWAFWAGVVSAVGLFTTLIFNYLAWKQGRQGREDTRRAIREARRSNLISIVSERRARREAVAADRHTQAALRAAQKNAGAAAKLVDTSEKNARRELRAYVDIDYLRLARKESRDTEDRQWGGVAGCLRNFGKTPAENVTIKLTYGRANPGGIISITSIEDKGELGGLSPSDTMEWKDFFGFQRPLWDELLADKWKLHVTLDVTYKDAFGDPHSIHVAYNSDSGDEDLSFVSGTRKIT